MKRILPAGLICISLLIVACSSTGPAVDRFPNVVEITGCDLREEPDAWACLDWTWDGAGTLEILHTNTVFNCCPLDYGGQVSVAGGDILIEEVEGEGQCDCLCPYDILYRIEGLAAGTYALEVDELYLEPGNEAFRVTLELDGPDSGQFCLERNGYPFW